MATSDPRSARRRARASRAEAGHLVSSRGLGVGLVLVAFALLLGPLATIWEGPLLAHVRAAMRGELSPTTAFVGLLAPVLAVAIVLMGLTVWGASRATAGAASFVTPRRGADATTERAPWSVVPLVIPLVLALVAVRATRWWVFAVHAAAADPAPLLFALSTALVWLCGGLGVVLITTSLVAMRGAAGRVHVAGRGSR